MSVYSQYRTGNDDTNSDIIANESYFGVAGAYRMIQESSDNEHAIFEAVINQDFCEAFNKIDNSVVSESELVSIQEATVKEIWSKVVEFLGKIGEKIMGLIRTLKTKLQMLFTKDGKTLVKNHLKQVNSASNEGKLSKMKFKYAAPKSAYANTTLEGKISGSKLMVDLSERINKSTNDVRDTNRVGGDSKYNPDDKDAFKDDFWKPISTEARTNYIEDALGKITGSSTDAKSFNKNFDESLFEEAKDEEGLSDTVLKTIVSVLEGNKDEMEALNKNERATSKTVKELTANAKKKETEMAKLSGSKDYSYNNKATNLVASQVITLANVYSVVAGKYYGELGSAFKKNYKQCRAIFTKAATYNPKQSANEQVELLTGVEESSDYEVDEMFDAVLA
jgi:hypothetical protein